MFPFPMMLSAPLLSASPRLLAIGAPGLPELAIIAFIILLLFGGSKLPSLMRNLGRSTKEFKEGMRESHDDDDDVPAGS